MDCQEARGKFYLYLDGELSLQEENALEDHLSFCRQCRWEFDLARETELMLKEALCPVAPPADLAERIMARIPDHTPGTWVRLKKYLQSFARTWKNRWGGWRWRTAAVTVGLVALILAGGRGNIFLMPAEKKQPENTPIAALNPEKTAHVSTEAPVSESGTPTPAASKNNEDHTGSPGVAEPGADGKKPSSGTGSPQPGQKPSTDAKPKTSVIDLPRYATGTTQGGSVKMGALIEDGERKVCYPYLTEQGKVVRYLVSGDEGWEEWELELKEGAEPRKAQTEVILHDGEYAAPGVQMPEWLASAAPAKDARSKAVAWSPDQKQVAVNINSADDDFTGLWIGQADGSALLQAAPEGGGLAVAWSPDGRKVAFTDQEDNLYILYLNLTENLLLQVTDDSAGFADIGRLVWTPDSKEVVFDGQKKDGTYGIYRIVLP